MRRPPRILPRPAPPDLVHLAPDLNLVGERGILRAVDDVLQPSSRNGLNGRPPLPQDLSFLAYPSAVGVREGLEDLDAHYMRGNNLTFDPREG